jgi:PAS domain S-box-containing protein
MGQKIETEAGSLSIPAAPPQPHPTSFPQISMSVVPAATSTPDRITAMRRTDLLDTPGEEGFARLGRLACRFLDAPVALISLVDEHRQFKACVSVAEPGAGSREMPLPHPFCRHVVEVGAPLVIRDARAHPLAAHDLALEGLVVAAYMGIPLVTPEGNMLGSFGVIDVRPRHWTDEQVQVLADLAVSVQTEIRLREAVRDSRLRGQLAEAQSVAQLTDHEQAERELQRREEYFRRLTENAHDMVVVLGPDNVVRYVSPSIERILGYTPEELTARIGVINVHPEDARQIEASFTELAARPAETVTAQYRLQHRDGSWRVVEAFAHSLSASSLEDGIVVNARDITERKEFEAALQERETRFRRLTENSSDLVQIIYPDGRMGYTGPSVVHLLGYTPEEIAGLSNMDYIHPDDHRAVAETMEAIFSSPGASRSVRYRVRHKDGRWRVFEAFGRTLLPDSAAEGLVCNARDVTERHEALEVLRRSEEHFRRLIENAYDMVLVMDGAGTITYASPSAQRVLGSAPEELTGSSGFSLLHPDDVDTAVANTTETFATPGVVVSAELRLRHRDGSYRVLETFCRTVADDSAESGIVVNARDVTERRQIEAEAERAREAAERANRAKSEFLSRMSHELRTPMNSILGFAQLLDRASLPPEHRKGVGHIIKGGRHLLQLINEVLEIARIEAGRLSLSLEPVRAGTVLQEAVALVRPLAAQWRVELDEGPWPGCGAYVQGDRQHFTQVLLNLLGNAIKYNRAGGRVRVSCETVADGERQRLALRVEDTGRGIDPDRADQLFTPFARLGAEQSEVEGTGLGLALSHRLTEAMGGTLTLESTGPEGSIFRLELPITADPLKRLEDPAVTAASLEGAPHAPATLLYIEDNVANLNLVEAILLARPRWRIIPALRGLAGIDLAREHVPDLILLDLHLPDTSGEEVLRRLRADPRTASIPVVVITADATQAMVERLRAASADAYLTKPLEIDEFLQTLERFLPDPT